MCARTRSFSASTTHYAELKEYALDTDGVCNACCEFDIETLRPTYRLIIGTPGRSNAFAISRKLGLDEYIVKRAESYVSGDNRRFEAIIDQLEEKRASLEKERAEAASLRTEYEAYKQEKEKDLRLYKERTEREIERQRAAAMQIVESARATSEYVLEQLEEVKRKRDSSDLSDSLSRARQNIRRSLREADDRINPVVNMHSDKEYKLPRPLKIGDEVQITSLGKAGTVLEISDKNDSATVQAGIIKTRDR